MRTIQAKPENYTARMKRKIDSDEERYRYSRRLGIVEPVFANISSAHRLKRFSLSGRAKVNTQWQLFCLVHNLGKIHRFGKTQKDLCALKSTMKRIEHEHSAPPPVS